MLHLDFLCNIEIFQQALDPMFEMEGKCYVSDFSFPPPRVKDAAERGD